MLSYTRTHARTHTHTHTHTGRHLHCLTVQVIENAIEKCGSIEEIGGFNEMPQVTQAAILRVCMNIASGKSVAPSDMNLRSQEVGEKPKVVVL